VTNAHKQINNSTHGKHLLSLVTFRRLQSGSPVTFGGLVDF